MPVKAANRSDLLHMILELNGGVVQVNKNFLELNLQLAKMYLCHSGHLLEVVSFRFCTAAVYRCQKG